MLIYIVFDNHVIHASFLSPLILPHPLIKVFRRVRDAKGENVREEKGGRPCGRHSR